VMECGHKIVKYVICGEVILQCRCMDKNKETIYRLCDKCKEKAND